MAWYLYLNSMVELPRVKARVHRQTTIVKADRLISQAMLFVMNKKCTYASASPGGMRRLVFM